MQIKGGTILVTGGGSGIGRGLAELFHRKGAKVIISGRRDDVLQSVVSANPGMAKFAFDITDPRQIRESATTLLEQHPALDALVNNAGIMRAEDLNAEPVDVATAEAEISTNLLGPIRLTSALLPHLKARPQATIINISSGLAFVPFTRFATYCATKAAIHSYSQSLRYQLRETGIRVLEIAPPYVQTALAGEAQAKDPNAMPLTEFLSEIAALLDNPPADGEILVDRVNFQRRAESEGRYNDTFAAINSF